MGKRDALLREMGAHLEESIGVRRAPVRTLTLSPKPAIPEASPKDGFARHRAAGEMLLSNIIPDPEQPRKEFDQGAIERLSESIKTKGLLQPLRVRWNADLGKHVILCGERRYRAAKLAGLVAVPCIFVETELTEAEILEEQLVENLLREDLNPIEEAHSFRRYMELVGSHAKDLAQLLKINPTTVTRALSLLKLPAVIQEQVAVGDIPAKTGIEIAKLNDPGAQQHSLRSGSVARGVEEGACSPYAVKDLAGQERPWRRCAPVPSLPRVACAGWVIPLRRSCP
jgi:ParB family transcriptional regulator, chromosome partitioning protein